MARRNAIVRRLSSVETLGCTTVICTDKTGTLTANEMTVRRVWTPGGVLEVDGVGYAPEGEITAAAGDVDAAALAELARAGALCNDAALEQRDGALARRSATRRRAALLTLAHKAGLDPVRRARTGYPRRGELPFDSARKRMTTVHDAGRAARRLRQGRARRDRARRTTLGEQDAPRALAAADAHGAATACACSRSRAAPLPTGATADADARGRARVPRARRHARSAAPGGRRRGRALPARPGSA